MRALVINADDFGLTPGINAGILDAHRHGALTSASLMATADAADEAIAIARDTPTLGIGCHLTLVDGRSRLPASALPTLTIEGRFRMTWGAFVSACAAGRVSLLEIERELTSQIERLLDAGLTLSHLDSHKHVHLYPPIFAIVARLAVRFGIPSVRIPYESPALDLVLRHRHDRHALRQAGENLLMAPWARGASRRLARSALPPAPRFLGRALTGRWSVPSLAEIIRRLPPGVSELMAHPGYPDEALARMRTRLRIERADEVTALRSPLVRQSLDREQIRLVRHGVSVTA